MHPAIEGFRMRLSFISPEYLWLLLVLPALWWITLLAPRRLGPARFWSSLGLRSALLVALILSVAGAQLVRPVDELTTVFLLDSSDSVSPSARGQAESFIQQALEAMPDGDRAAVVVFGKNALVERAPSNLPMLGTLHSAPIVERTNIEEAINLGLALLPADAQKRLVLLSDGGENDGQALEAARLASARGVPIAFVDLSAPGSSAEAMVAGVEAPARVRAGQEFEIAVTVESAVAQAATLRITGDETLLTEQQVQLQPGTNRFTWKEQAVVEGGFQRYRAEIALQNNAGDRVQNNAVDTLVQVQGPPRVLLVEGPGAGRPSEAQQLVGALEAAEITVETVAVQAMPTDLAGLSAYEAVMLVNVPARDVPVKAMAALPSYVRDLGKGLIMIGGDRSYGVGGYGRTPLEEALPVYMDVRDREQRPNLALVLVIDKSGSMDACHCSGPNRQTAQFREGGARKVDIAKEAVIKAASVLGPQDSFGVVTFDEAAHWTLPTRQGAGLDEVESAVSPVAPEGSTNVREGLLAAEEALRNVDARIKHAILLTDGWSGGGDNMEVARRMQEAGVTLSVVAAGGGSADYLNTLAETGGGRYYPAETMEEVPDIFLQETITAVGNYIVEEPLVPALLSDSPIVENLGSAWPTIYGYNGTTLKDTAQAVLVAPDESPILAQWQYGLGRAIAWTSDTQGRWGRDLVRWEQFPRFAAQLVGWVLPSGSSTSLNANLQVEGTQTIINVHVEGDQQPSENLELAATVIGGDGSKIATQLLQVAPGEYRATIPSPPPGTYLVQLAGSADGRAIVQDTAGLVVPYSPEYRSGQSNLELLRAISDLTEGTQLAEPAQAFAHTEQNVTRAREIGLPLLWLALLLLPLDIALRRLLLRRGDLSAFAWRNTGAASAAAQAPRSATLAGLQQAEERGEARLARQAAPPPAESSAPAAPSNDERLARLREARDRARRRARGDGD
jgi:uncharacterized membrane protein/NAD(P)H-hydrate repair Nnr-like enzyme with NAD(P)H-hydrate epimerase domain